MKAIALLMPEEYLYAHRYFRPLITPNGDDTWMGIKFIVNPKAGNFDAVVVHQSTQSLDQSYTLCCPPTKTLLVLKEPPDILFLPEAYTSQFYCTLGQDKRVRSKKQIFSQAGHHWFVEVGIHETEVLNNQKTKLISAIVSNKTDTEGHRKRLRFVQKLKEHFADQLDWFGRGVRELEPRKLNGLLNYKYHIVLENGRWNDYWTEKLADSFVANCFPFYWGAPNIHQYFKPDQLRLIDIENIEASIQTIEQAISQNLYEVSQEAIANARAKVFDEYHPYQTYLNILNQLPASMPSQVTIRPHREFKYSFKARCQVKLQHYSKNLFQV
ncbi:hypothetical protein H6F87_07395 [Cyanobacteria bacterium FACHB-502]|nr:hypothetical protein [Cyanobacteria bacterium FACHB-502]